MQFCAYVCLRIESKILRKVFDELYVAMTIDIRGWLNLFFRSKFLVIRAFRNHCILGDTDGYWGSYGF